MIYLASNIADIRIKIDLVGLKVVYVTVDDISAIHTMNVIFFEGVIFCVFHDIAFFATIPRTYISS